MTLEDLLAEANAGIIGLDADLQVFGGYDTELYAAHPGTEHADWTEVLTRDQKIALADLMLERWSRYKKAVEVR